MNERNATIVRIILTIVLLVFMWMGHDWALYLAVTFSAVSHELSVLVFEKRKKDDSL